MRLENLVNGIYQKLVLKTYYGLGKKLYIYTALYIERKEEQIILYKTYA